MSLAASALEAIVKARQRTGVRFVSTPGCCNLDSVRACIVRFSCTSLWIRMPFIYPFSCGSLHNEFPGQYHTTESIDWIWLGNSLDIFEEYIDEYISAHHPESIDVVLFDSMTGRLFQDDGTGEVEVHLKRAVLNYNLEHWNNACATLLNTEEIGWPQVVANTVDYHPYLAPHLEKYVRTPPRRIVDLGCGLGQTARSLALRYPDAQVIGIDASEAALEVARHHFRMDNLHFLTGNIGEMLPFPDGSVDLAVSINALMYGPNQPATAHEVFRVMHDQGVLIHYSRMLESHMFWDFPMSFAGPTLFQLNAIDWIAAGREYGAKTIIKDSPDMKTRFPGFFFASKSDAFSEAYSTGIDAERASGSTAYRPWNSHALMVHAGFLQDSTADLENPAYLDRLDQALPRICECNPSMMDAAIMAWNTTFTTLDLCPEAKDFLRLSLPLSHETLAAVILAP